MVVISSSGAADRHCRGGWVCCAASCLSQGHFTQTIFEGLCSPLHEGFVQTVGELSQNSSAGRVVSPQGSTGPSYITLVINTAIFGRKNAFITLEDSKTTWGKNMANKFCDNFGLLCRDKDKNVLCSSQISVELNNFCQILHFSPRGAINI